MKRVCTGPMEFTPYRPWSEERRAAARERLGSFWHGERPATVKRMWEVEGATYEAIAEHLGHGATRNMVAGFINRNGYKRDRALTKLEKLAESVSGNRWREPQLVEIKNAVPKPPLGRFRVYEVMFETTACRLISTAQTRRDASLMVFMPDTKPGRIVIVFDAEKSAFGYGRAWRPLSNEEWDAVRIAVLANAVNGQAQNPQRVRPMAAPRVPRGCALRQ